jgi:hypothetical protein
MTKDEALQLLNEAQTGDTPSQINPSLTISQALNIVRTEIMSEKTPNVLGRLTEKRVWQVVRNQRRPNC